MAATRLQDLALIIAEFDSANRLTRVKTPVDVRHEIGGIAHKVAGPVLFEQPRGQEWPVVAGVYHDAALLGEMLGGSAQTTVQRLAEASEGGPMPLVVPSGAVLEVTESTVDLGRIPIPVLALEEVAPRLDALAIAKDPETGARHVSMLALRVAGREILHAELEAGNALADFAERAAGLGRSLWLTLNCGVAPALHLAACVNGNVALSRDALGMAGALAGAPVALVPGAESDVEMSADAMWALECEMSYSGVEAASKREAQQGRAVLHVRRVHRRMRPVFQAMLPAETEHLTTLARAAHILALLRRQVPGARDVHIDREGGRHAVVQIAGRHARQARHVMLAAFAASPALDVVTVVDDAVDIRSGEAVAKAMATRFDPDRGVLRLEDELLGRRIGFDVTGVARTSRSVRPAFKPVSLEAHELVRAAAPSRDHTGLPQPRTPRETPANADANKPDGDAARAPQHELAEWREIRPSPAVAMPAANDDWDESRWWRREIEAMKQPQAPDAAAKPRSPAIASGANGPKPSRAAEPRQSELRPVEEEDGGFFRDGAA